MSGTLTRAELMTFLDDLGIVTTTVEHPALFTVAQSQELRGRIEGGHTKNLFLKDKKGRYFLLTVGEELDLDLKSIHQKIGGSGRVSFGKPEDLARLLGVTPGAVTALGIVNDRGNEVTIVFDRGLMAHDVINCHPLTNEATTSIRGDDLLKFVRATGHEPTILDLGA